MSIHVVPSGHRGVVKMFGDVQKDALPEGLHLLNPLASVVDFNIRYQSVTADKAEGGTSDLQDVFEDITLNYSFDSAHAADIYNDFGNDDLIETQFIKPALFESFKAVSAVYTAEQLVTERKMVSQQIVKTLQAKLDKYHVIVSDINVQNFHFDEKFADAVRRKVVAGQDRLTAEQTLQTAQIVTQQKVIEAEGNAKAIAIQAQAVEQQGGDKFIALEAIKKWDGRLPQQWSGGAIPFVNLASSK